MFENLFPASDPVLIFAILIITALFAPILVEKIKLPGIIGLIVAGIIFGPHGLALLERGSEVELLGTIGLLYIMFLAGLELDIVQFIKHKNHSIIFGALTFFIPLILGTLMGRYMLWFTWPAAILLATMFSSHTLITYPIASRLGLSRQKAVTTTIGGTLITDTAALLALAVIAAQHKGDPSALFWGKMFFYMALYVGGVLILLPYIGRWFFRRIATDGIIAYTGVLAAVFLCGFLAHIAGLEPIIGAFLAGLILNSLIPENSPLMNRIQFVGHSLFIPVFLISVGMLVNIGLLFEGGKAAVVAASMVIAGIVTKWLAAGISRRALSYNHNEGMLIFGLSVNQAAATLAAVLVGYNIGIFTEPVLTGTIIMILVTSLLGSWITDRYARAVALAEEDKPYSTSDAPHRILIPISDPRSIEGLMDLAIFLRRKSSHEPLYPITIAESGENIDERLADAEKLLGAAVVKAASGDVPVIPITRAAIAVTTGIRQAMIDMRISIVILGWKGEVSSRSRVFGRTLDYVIESSRQMILVSRCPNPLNTIKRVIVAIPPLIEHQPGFETAVRAVKTLTQQLGASLLTVSVPPTIDSVRKIISAAPPKLNEDDILLKRWDGLLPWLNDNVSHKDDFFILFSVRKGRLAWQPNLSKLPRIVLDNIPDINFSVFYPPEMSWDGSQEETNSSAMSCLSLLPPQHIQLDLKGTAIEEAIAKLIEPEFKGKFKIINKITSALMKMELMELAPGVVLFHAHIPEVIVSTAFLGVNKDGWELPHTTEKTKAVFLLLSPKDATPAMHLKALAELIGPLRGINAAEELSGAESVEDIIELFSKGALADSGEKIDMFEDNQQTK